MICTENERDTCNVEKMGCNGCFYEGITEEEKEAADRVHTQVDLLLSKMNRSLSDDINIVLNLVRRQQEQIDYLTNKYISGK